MWPLLICVSVSGAAIVVGALGLGVGAACGGGESLSAVWSAVAAAAGLWGVGAPALRVLAACAGTPASPLEQRMPCGILGERGFCLSAHALR